MKKLLFFLLLATTSLAQNFTIKGTIEEANTGEKLPFVSVYINNTAKGTYADANGNFQIQHISLSKVELIASMIGYETYRQVIDFKKESVVTVKIILKPSENALNEVVVTAKKDKKWQNQYNRFLKEFLGNTPFARQCEVKNGHLLQFDENKTTEEFSAKASQPIEIQNEALGYKVFFELKKFSVLPTLTTITGFTRYIPLSTDKPEQLNKWKTNRQKAYLGSEKHFFSTIFNKSWEKEGFIIYRVNPMFRSDKKIFSSIEEQLGKRLLPFDSTHAIIQQILPNNDRKISIPKEIEVLYSRQSKEFSYRDAPYPVSWVYSPIPLEITPSGNIQNAQYLEFSGEMANRRIAEMLPLDYEPNQDVEMEEEPTIVAQNGYTKYQEFPYLHLNKPFYHSGEKLWFKAYMFYQTPTVRDSLSKVLYVELIDEQDKILSKRIISLQNGIGWGDFTLPKVEQNYRIRAYTLWMLNYGEKNLFQRNIAVVSPTKKVILEENKIAKNDLFDTEITAQPTDSCEVYSVKIRLKNPSKKANFSVSVVNSSAVDEGNDHIQNFKPAFGAWAFQQKYEPEQSITINGRVSPAKATNIGIMNREDGRIRITSSDSLGVFSLSDYQFADSLSVGIQAEKNLKISLEEPYSPAIFKTFVPKKKTISTPVQTVDNQSDNQSVALEEVVVKANTIVNNERKEYLDRMNKIYGTADVTIDSKTIAESAGATSNLLNVLQARVPGVRVVERLASTADELSKGLHATYIEIRTATTQTFQSSTAALLLVDGVRMEDTNGFLDISPYNVERIDIIKSAIKASIFGAKGYNGAIAVYTKTGSNKRQQTDSKEVDYQSFKIAGYTTPQVFRTVPCQETNARTTLLWLPSISTDEKGEATFTFSANPATKFRIIIEGMNENGEVGSFIKKH